MVVPVEIFKFTSCFAHLQERNIYYCWYCVLVIVLFKQLEGSFSCSIHFRARALKHVKLDLLVPSAARAFGEFHEETFLASSVEPTIEIFCGICVLSISEFVTSLAKASPVDVVVIVFGSGPVLPQEEFGVVLCHDCILDM